MATFHWYGGWTGNTGFNSGFSTNGLIGASAQSLWTSVYTGYATDKGDYAFSPYYWGFVQNWREVTNSAGVANVQFATRLPRGGDTIFIGPAEGSVTGPGHTHKIPVSLLFGGLTNDNGWLGSTAGTTASFRNNAINISFQPKFGKVPAFRYQIPFPPALPVTNQNFNVTQISVTGQPNTMPTVALNAAYCYIENPYVPVDLSEPTYQAALEYFRSSTPIQIVGVTGNSNSYYIAGRDRAPRIGAGVYWDPALMHILASGTGNDGSLTATSNSTNDEEFGVPRRYRASLHVGSVGFDNSENGPFYVFGQGQGSLSTKQVMQGALEGIQTHIGITSNSYCTIPLALMNSICHQTHGNGGCGINKTFNFDPSPLYSNIAPTNATAAAVSNIANNTLIGVVCSEDPAGGLFVGFNGPTGTLTVEPQINSGSFTSIRKAVVNLPLNSIGGLTANSDDLKVIVSGGGCNGGKVGMGLLLPDNWNVAAVPLASLSNSFVLAPWEACIASYTQPTDNIYGNSISHRQAKLDDITAGLTSFNAKTSVSSNWYGSAALSLFINESDTSKVLKFPTGLTFAPTGCASSSLPVQKALFMITRNAPIIPIAVTGSGGGLSANVDTGLDPIDIMGNGGYIDVKCAHVAKVAFRNVGLTTGTNVGTNRYSGYSGLTGVDIGTTKYAGYISHLYVGGGMFEALSHENTETKFVDAGSIITSNYFNGLILNENTNENESGIPGNVSIRFTPKQLKVIKIPCAVQGTVEIMRQDPYDPTAAGIVNPQSDNPSISIGSSLGIAQRTYPYVIVDLGGTGADTGTVDLEVDGATIESINIRSGTVRPSNSSLPIGIYPIFRNGVIRNGKILTNSPNNPSWNNTLIGYSPGDTGIQIQGSNSRLGETDDYSILFSPGMNIRTSPGVFNPGLT
jgi:hypothetical protein